jgi:hypothetical protein
MKLGDGVRGLEGDAGKAPPVAPRRATPVEVRERAAVARFTDLCRRLVVKIEFGAVGIREVLDPMAEPLLQYLPRACYLVALLNAPKVR